MCKHYPPKHNSDVYYHTINPDPLNMVIFSFGFYIRNDHHKLNPYGLIPIPSANLYLGPFDGEWTFGVNLRIRCERKAGLCLSNIDLAKQIHSVWNKSKIWQTHPKYYNAPDDRGIDFISEPDANVLYIIKGNVNPHYDRIRIWLTGNGLNAPADIEITEVEKLPDGGFDLIKWILDRIHDINNLGPLVQNRAVNNLNPILLH